MDIVSQVVLAALRVHPSRSVGQNELARVAGCTSRQVRASVTHLRRQGWLVVGDGSGYHLARNIEEVHGLLKHISDQVDRLEELQAVLYQAAQSRFREG